MKQILENFNRGSIGMIQLISWGLTIVTFAGGITYAAFSATNNQVIELKERTATVEEAISTLKDDNKEIKSDVKLILQKLK